MGGESSRQVKVMFGNVQSIVNKIEEVRAIMALEKPDIVAFTETWTHGEIQGLQLRLTYSK